MNERVANVLERTWANLSRVWRRISQTDRTDFGRVRADLPDTDAVALRRQIEECLASKGGEVSSRARAAAIGHLYMTLNDRGRVRFFEILAGEFGVDRSALLAAIEKVREANNGAGHTEAERQLRDVLTPRHIKLLTQFNSLPAGVKFLVDLRADVLSYGKSDARLRGLERDLRDLLASWFDVGFLELKRITWNSPAALLERLIAYEAVHEIESWEDLKHRLGDDRRCFAFFHPRMPDEPLVFVEVALVPGMSDNIQALLDESVARPDSHDARAAIFYSISNAQKGLQGVNLGSFLIKRVVDELIRELPGLKTFATLSPIPGFASYLRTRLGAGIGLASAERERLEKLNGSKRPDTILAEVLGAGNWHRDENAAAALKGPLMRLCAEYLIDETRRGGRAPDQVANFHLSNGARIERINWLADTSERGLGQSAGLMVNYRYEPGWIEQNHENYRTNGAAAASGEVQELLRMPEERREPEPSGPK